jgi:hypothetical protein
MGTGRLSTAVAHSLAVVHRPVQEGALKIVCLGRDLSKARWLVTSAAARAAAFDGRIEVHAGLVRWEDPDFIAEALHGLRPDLIVHFASLQSPWNLTGQDAWSNFVRKAGYGITTPFHLPLVLLTAKAAAAADLTAPVVNACFPDIVNPILSRLGYPAICGIGNIGILVAFLRASIGTAANLRVLANHSHVADFIRGAVPTHRAPLVEINGHSVDSDSVISMLPPLPSGPELNAVTGATAVPVLLALSGLMHQYRGHVPGPLGLPGGYPVNISEGKLELDFPDAVALESAIRWNEKTSLADGLSLEDNSITYVGDAGEALRRLGRPARFQIADLRDMLDCFGTLRDELSAGDSAS